MTTKQRFLTKMPTNKLTMALMLAISLSACSTTTSQQSPYQNLDSAKLANQSADIECQTQAQNIANHAESAGSSAQYLSAAKAMNTCVSTALKSRAYNRSNNTSEHDTVIMKMMAGATFSFIKSGDVISAKREVVRFRRSFPNQDLYFADYTSFLDTATALLAVEPLPSSQLSALNISRVLRDEIERKHYWLSH